MSTSALRRAARVELARRHLTDFSSTVLPWFETPCHIRYLAALLERVERGEIKRLAISAPPGHGKSSLLQAFVAWFLGRDARRRILALSASEALAKRNSRATRAIVQSDEWPWPDIRLVGEALEEWQTSEGGGVRAIGQTGTVTGFRAEMILCDDVQPDAGSDTTRESLEEWFRGVLSTRLEPDGVVVLIQTRWHDDDLIGRLQQGESAKQWSFVNLPAIAAENDPLGRSEGEALWPERWPLEALLDKKAEVTAREFGAQYNGDPVPSDGRTFKPDWMKRRHKNLTGSGLWRVMAIDSAWKDGLHNDPSVLATWGSDMRDYFLLDVWRNRVQFPDLKAAVIEQYKRTRPDLVLCEEASSGFALVQELRLLTGIPIVGVNPKGSKEARAQAVTGLFEAGKVLLPEQASWLNDWMEEHLRFPGSKHDDQVDTTSLALGYMHQKVLERLAWQRECARYRNLNWMAR